MLKSVNTSYIFLYVRDLAAARRYYEQKLGFRIVEQDARAVKYDAGDIMLALNSASDYGLTLHDAPDSLLVFHTGSIEPVVERLRRSDVKVGDIDRYEIGALAELKDPDSHCLSVYEPSAEALGWPSAGKIRAILGKKVAGKLRNGGAAPGGAGRDMLGDCPMIYLFLFIRDPAVSAAFYGGLLGLNLLECSACSAGGPDNGVAKYDAGSIILTTHHSEELAKKAVDTSRHKGLSVVFNVDDIEHATDDLRTAGLTFASGIINSGIGKIIRFSDPDGHDYYLHEPSSAARDLPSGRKTRDLIAKYAV
jgi:catechol 2,3-dioxygenase-like lactoylglutathione lyase family enzyme